MTDSYSVESSLSRLTHGPDVENISLENKISRSHYKILSKLIEFFGDDSVWLTATLCKTVW